jgi:hypothetical protein
VRMILSKSTSICPAVGTTAPMVVVSIAANLIKLCVVVSIAANLNKLLARYRY